MPGFHHLFVPGPTNVPERVRQAMNVSMEDMRAVTFPEFTRPLFSDLAKVFQNSTGRVFVYPSSGTGMWEAAIQNVLSPGDRVLMANYGNFSQLWARQAERLGLRVHLVECEWGDGLPLETFAEELRRDDRHEIKAVFATHNETSTGVTIDIAAVRKVLDESLHPALLFVDGVSSVGSIDFRQDEWGVDCAVCGSQKGFMLPAGLGFLSVSQKALEAAAKAGPRTGFFAFDDMVASNETGYFPYTPATQLLRGLRVALDLMNEEGLDNVFKRHNRLAEGVRSAVQSWNLKLCANDSQLYSDTVSAVVVPLHADSAAVVRCAQLRYQTALGGGLQRLAGRVFRIGHIGWLNEVMVCGALAAAEMALIECGVSIAPGSGVGAAIDYFAGPRDGKGIHGAKASEIAA